MSAQTFLNAPFHLENFVGWEIICIDPTNDAVKPEHDNREAMMKIWLAVLVTLAGETGTLFATGEEERPVPVYADVTGQFHSMK